MPLHAPLQSSIRFARRFALSVLCVAASSWLTPHLLAQAPTTASSHQRMRDSDQWAQIQPHLPNPKTASPQALELQGDILRARRFPEDAMDYYKYAMARGGNVPNLLNKLGLAELEMQNIQLAQTYFQCAVKLDRHNAEAWNNLGAVEYADGRTDPALGAYKRAIRLNRHEAVFHANLASAYFDTKNYRATRREIATALELDPEVFERVGTGGLAAHVLTSADHARFAFEMAKMYARSDMEPQMLRSLAVAAEAGMDVQTEMARDPALARYQMDPRVLVLVHNARMTRANLPRNVSSSSAAPAASPL